MTSSDPLHAYMEASRNLSAARGRAKDMTERIGAVATPFRYNWAGLRVVHGREFRGGDGAHERVDLENWPDRDEVWDTIRAYHDAFHEAQQAWAAIPPDDRFGLRPPSHAGE